MLAGLFELACFVLATVATWREAGVPAALFVAAFFCLVIGLLLEGVSINILHRLAPAISRFADVVEARVVEPEAVETAEQTE